MMILLSVFSCAPHVSYVTGVSSEASTALPTGIGVTPTPTGKTEYTAKITDLAKTSTCASTNWSNRGRAPAGYVKGIALSYARSLCRIKNGSAPAGAKILKAPSSGNPSKDILAHYQDLLAVAGLHVNQAGDAALHSAYTVGIGLGMRESSGKYCEGWDTSAGSNRPSAAAEAGLFQVSYDSIGASPEMQKMYDEYKANPQRCLLSSREWGT